MSASVDEPEPMDVDEDEALLVLSLKWTTPDVPQKMTKQKTSLEKMLQSWCNKCKCQADCSVKEILADGRVVIKIKPAPGLTELQKLYKQPLKKDGSKVTITSITLNPPELDTQIPEDASSVNSDQSELQTLTKKDSNEVTKTSINVTPPELDTQMPADALTKLPPSLPEPQTEPDPLGDQSSQVSAAQEQMNFCSVPVGHFWYMNHMYREEMECIKKENGVKMLADVNVKFEAEKDGSPDKALDEFINLVQKCIPESSGPVIPVTALKDPDQWSDALKIIQKKENKLLVTLSSEEIAVCGPRHSQDAISKALHAVAQQKTDTNASAEKNESDFKDTPLKIAMNIKDPLTDTGLTMEESYWKLMSTAYEEKVERIKKKFNVDLTESGISQGKVNVRALYRKDGGNASMENHALRALFHLYQKIATSPMNFPQYNSAPGFWDSFKELAVTST